MKGDAAWNADTIFEEFPHLKKRYEVVDREWVRLRDSGRRRLRRIGDYRAVHAGKRRQRVYLKARCVDDFLGADAVDHKRVGDQRTMAAPRHRLGAHQRDSLALCLLDEA